MVYMKLTSQADIHQEIHNLLRNTANKLGE